MTPLSTLKPGAQLAPMLQAYDKAVAAKRRQIGLGLVLLVIAFLVACYGAEVQPATFWDKLGNFTSYFARLTHLDTGAHVWTDPAYWFWGLRRWSLQLGQTILIAYVGTVTGAAIALVGGVLGSRNLSGRMLCASWCAGCWNSAAPCRTSCSR